MHPTRCGKRANYFSQREYHIHKSSVHLSAFANLILCLEIYFLDENSDIWNSPREPHSFWTKIFRDRLNIVLKYDAMKGRIWRNIDVDWTFAWLLVVFNTIYIHPLSAYKFFYLTFINVYNNEKHLLSYQMVHVFIFKTSLCETNLETDNLLHLFILVLELLSEIFINLCLYLSYVLVCYSLCSFDNFTLWSSC